MSNIIVDGFGHYGTNAANTLAAVQQAVTSGAWATYGAGWAGIATLPWDAQNKDTYAVFNFTGEGLTRALPASIAQTNPSMISFYFATNVLPGSDNERFIVDFRDGGNNIISYLRVRPTGALVFGNANAGSTHESAGPVIVAETVTHIEIKYVPGTGSNGTAVVKANGVTVINASGMTVPSHASVAIFGLGASGISSSSTAYYIGHLIFRNNAGSYNNDFVGDRKVATLIVNANDAGHQGWTASPLHRFGNGILQLGIAAYPGGSPVTNAGVFCGSTTETDLGNLDFTIEGQFRFQSLPTGSLKSVIFGKWSEADNQRSYQLFIGGPSLNSGNTVFRISTDGTAATVVNKISYPWAPIMGQDYHVCLERLSGVTTLYIDGVPQGAGVSDATAYFAGSARTAIGIETSGGSPVFNTSLYGWQDEFRMTKALARYGAPFTPPVAAFPRGPVDDIHWSDVPWISGWDTASVVDESGFSRALSAVNGAAAITPNDGGFAYQCINKNYASDDTFIQAAFLFASAIYTQSVQPANNDTVTVGTTDGSTPAVYTFKTTLTGAAFEVKIGAALLDSLANLVLAIMAGAGAGTNYGTGTTANHDVSAISLPVNQIQVSALIAGTTGNSIAVSKSAANGSWGVGVTTLSGGVNIPGYSQFTTQHLPAGASIVDSITLIRRSWKTDAGSCTARLSFVGPGAGVQNGATITESTAPTLYHDTIEVDPDNPSNPLTPTAVLQGKIKIDRTG